MNYYREYKPSLALSKYVTCIWVHRCVDHDFLEREHLVVPDNTIELVLSNEMITRKTAEGTQIMGSHLAGIKTMPQWVGINDQLVIGVRFKAYGLYRFTEFSISKTVDSAIDPYELFGLSFCALEEKVLNTKDESKQVMLIDNYLHQQLEKTHIPVDPVFEKMARIVIQNHNISLDKIATRMNFSRKTMERKFNKQLGLPPKKYVRVLRFYKTLKSYFQSRPNRLSELAYENGYFDQMHFIKDIKLFTGLTPSDYFNPLVLQSTIQSNMFEHEVSTIGQNTV